MGRGKKQKRGNIVAVKVEEGRFCFALALTSPLYAFFDGVYATIEAPQNLEVTDIIFKVPVMDYATKSGRWPIIGKIDLGEHSAIEESVFFKQDPIDGKITSYDLFTANETPITFEQADQLECAAVWDPAHIEDRLRDHIARVPNKWWSSLRPKR